MKKEWHALSAAEKATTKRSAVVAIAALCAFAWQIRYHPFDSRWPSYAWLLAMPSWTVGEILRDQKSSDAELSFWMGAGAGFLVLLCVSCFSWNLIVHGMIAAWTAAYLFGLGHWPKPDFESPIVVPIAPPAPPTTFGSAQWGTLEYMQQHRLLGTDGLLLGVIPGDDEPHRLSYSGDRHLLTIAPTGSGKGTTAIIPNLLNYPGSCLVVDPKGENALITATRRRQLCDQVYIVDPWGIAADAGSSARFNPLDWLVAGDLDIAENAMLLADALIAEEKDKDSFWDQEAKALLQGVILYVATDEHEADDRHLARVRDLLLLDGEDLRQFFERMRESVHHVVASTGARSLQKDPKTLSNVLASVQAHTHFLDSPRLRANLSASDFRFEDLKANPTTVYLVLPADRLGAFGRWLRLLIQQAITVTARDVANKPRKPVLFILDELPSLGRLAKVREAYGLMRGFGMQIWGIVQDVPQMRELYGDGWETFIGNSGAITYHGSRDNSSADYFSKLCGEATVLNFSTSTSSSSTVNSSVSYGPTTTTSRGASVTNGHTFSIAHAQRKLAYPDELMRLGQRMQLVLIEHHRPIMARKLPWFEDPAFCAIGRNLEPARLEQGAEILGTLDVTPRNLKRV
ncbi:type IV secretory system conjugative DNA transfer family protein [Sphingomonas sp. HITSZ_GF]|uniref:type IV secretory system conjugative DNA transfer family protein n=1 Tax=Sphingomonas sp. HITSZ_GF TaxID=3037247 RepID=UPI00240D66B5|nr:type IV secretory system conjugative DNA transfer family protein [Sphingomonas sp. HITSZ_GF]